MIKFTHITTSIKEVFKRFPIAMINAIMGTIAGILVAHDFWLSEEDFLFRIIMTTVLGFLMFVSIQLYSERQKKTDRLKFIKYGGLLFLIVYYLLLPGNFEYASHDFIIRFILFGIGFLFSVTFAPFIASKKFITSLGSEINGFWQHNKGMVIRFFFTFLYMFVLYLGLVLALASIDNLLGIDIYEELYLELWIFVVGILATTFFLAGIEKKTDKLEKKTDYPKGIKIFSQYILTPLLSIYSVIITVYFVKILITGEWPKGMIVYLIFVFSFMGILTYFMLYPLRDKTESVWVKWFSRMIFTAIIPFTGMLFWAIYLRLDQYGLTERRYYVVVLGIWLFATAIYFLVSKKQNLKVITISLFTIALVTSFGPWGAISVSERSQVKRLERVLTANSILMNGKVQMAPNEVSREDVGHISGALDYLEDVHDFSKIQPWFDMDLEGLRWNRDDEVRIPPFSPNEVYNCSLASCKIMKKIMGLDYLSQRERDSEFNERMDRDYMSFNSNRMKTINIEGYKYMVHFSMGEEDEYRFRIGDDQYFLNLDDAGKLVTTDLSGEVVTTLDIGKLVSDLSKEYTSYRAELSSDEMSIAKDDAKVYLNHINITNISKDPVKIDYIEGDLLIK